MSARDELAKLLFVADNSGALDAEMEWRTAKPEHQDYAYKLADTTLAAGYRKPRTITTAAELEDLPNDSVLIAGYRLYQKDRGALMDAGIGLCGYEEVLDECGHLTLIHEPKSA